MRSVERLLLEIGYFRFGSAADAASRQNFPSRLGRQASVGDWRWTYPGASANFCWFGRSECATGKYGMFGHTEGSRLAWRRGLRRRYLPSPWSQDGFWHAWQERPIGSNKDNPAGAHRCRASGSRGIVGVTGLVACATCQLKSGDFATRRVTLPPTTNPITP